MTLGSILFSFEGRLNRQRFWLAYFGVSFGFGALAFLVAIIGGIVVAATHSGSDPQSGAAIAGLVMIAFWFIAGIAVFWSLLALLVKRYHDRNRTGWFIFISLIPIVGPIWYLIELCTGGTKGPNRFGADPLGDGSPSTGPVDLFAAAAATPKPSALVITLVIVFMLLYYVVIGLFYSAIIHAAMESAGSGSIATSPERSALPPAGAPGDQGPSF